MTASQLLLIAMTLGLCLSIPTLATATDVDGEKVYKKCKACHSFDEGKHGMGPSLAGLFGATAGTAERFKFSKTMSGSGVVWDDQSLDHFLENPKKSMPGTKMMFSGLRKPEDRAAVIAYMHGMTAPE